MKSSRIGGRLGVSVVLVFAGAAFGQEFPPDVAWSPAESTKIWGYLDVTNLSKFEDSVTVKKDLTAGGKGAFGAGLDVSGTLSLGGIAVEGKNGVLTVNGAPIRTTSDRDLQADTATIGSVTIGSVNIMGRANIGSANIGQPFWVNIAAFGTGWEEYGGFFHQIDSPFFLRVGVLKDSMGFVHLRGLVHRYWGPENRMFTLPSGFAPSRSMLFAVMTSGGQAGDDVVGRVEIDNLGNVVLVKGSAEGYVSLDGITFDTRPEYY